MWLRSTNLYLAVRVELVHVLEADFGPAAKLDLVYHNECGNTVFVSIVIASPLMQGLLRNGASARVPEAAATALPALKEHKYHGIPFTPFIADTYARVGESALT